MKLFMKVLCIATSIAMVLTMSGIGVFAAENVQPESVQPEGVQEIEQEVGPDQAAEDIDIDENVEGNVDENVDENVVQEEPQYTVRGSGVSTQSEQTGTTTSTSQTIRLAKPTVTALSGYNAIKLTWTPVPGADAYNVGFWDGGKYKSIAVTKRNYIEKKKLQPRTKYNFRVIAVCLKEESKNKSSLSYKDIDGTIKNGEWSGNVSPAAYVKNKQCVNRLRIYGKLKQTRKYGGVKMKSGTRIWSEDYGGGMYFFKNPKGRNASVGRINLRNQKASYIKKGGWNYTKAEAEYFVNGYMKAKKVSSKKKRMIWVSSYTQHLYIMEKKDGVWKATDWNWEVSMGKATTPSPTGNKWIHKTQSSLHGIPHWSYFSSGNALHGVRSGWGKLLGGLASHGCIRNKISNALIIKKKCGKGTRVVVY